MFMFHVIFCQNSFPTEINILPKIYFAINSLRVDRLTLSIYKTSEVLYQPNDLFYQSAQSCICQNLVRNLDIGNSKYPVVLK
jgi:hypothetical protein